MDRIDELIEAQNKVIRHVLDFMDQHSRRTRSMRGKGKPGARVHGMRRIEAELRRTFGFTERKCNLCKQWLPDGAFNKAPQGRAGLQPMCRECCKLARAYGGKMLVPPDVLREDLMLRQLEQHYREKAKLRRRQEEQFLADLFTREAAKSRPRT